MTLIKTLNEINHYWKIKNRLKTWLRQAQTLVRLYDNNCLRIMKYERFFLCILCR